MGGTHDVADDTADAGVGAPEGFDRRRVVVGLGLHRDGGAGGEADDAGVADEGAAQEGGGDGIGGIAQLAQQGGDLDLFAGRGDAGDQGAKGLVRAVFAPRLGQGLELDIGWLATDAAVVSGNDVQFGEVQRQAPLAAQCLECSFVEVADGDPVDSGVGGAMFVDEVGHDRALRPLLDDRVGQEAAGKGGTVGGADGAVEVEVLTGGHSGVGQPDSGTGELHRGGDWVRDPG